MAATVLAFNVTEYRVFCMVGQIKHTSAGLDNLPQWFLHLDAP